MGHFWERKGGPGAFYVVKGGDLDPYMRGKEGLEGSGVVL